jgi:hypothetical protein
MIVNNKAIGYHFVIIYYILFCITLIFSGYQIMRSKFKYG